MVVSIETTGGLERRLKIAVEGESFEQRINERLRSTTKRLKLDCFRPGKVPLKEVRRRFGASIRQEVAQEMIQSSYMEALQQEELAPAGSPTLDVINMDVGAILNLQRLSRYSRCSKCRISVRFALKSLRVAFKRRIWTQ